jgi:hypothetical protein
MLGLAASREGSLILPLYSLHDYSRIFASYSTRFTFDLPPPSLASFTYDSLRSSPVSSGLHQAVFPPHAYGPPRLARAPRESASLSLFRDPTFPFA